MFGHQTDVGPVDAVGVITFGTADVMGMVERFAKVATEQVLVAQFRTYRGASGQPVEIGIDVDTRYLATVIVVGHLVGCSAIEFKAVFTVIPVDASLEMQCSLDILSLQGGVSLERMLILVIPIGTIEGVGSISFDTKSGMPPCLDPFVTIIALPESLGTLVVGIEPSFLVTAVAIASGIGGRELVVPCPFGHIGSCPCTEIAEGASLQMHIGTGGVGSLGHDVDGTKHRRGTIHSSCRSLQHLDALNLSKVYGKVKGIVSSLWVTDVDAVEQNNYLLIVASTDADVSLGTNGSPLSDIHSSHILEQVIDTLYWRSLNVAAIQYGYHSHSLTLGQGRPRAGDAHLVERQFAVGLGSDGVGGQRFNTHTVGLGIGECGHAEGSDEHLASETGKQRIALASETAEHHGLAPVGNVVVLHDN